MVVYDVPMGARRQRFDDGNTVREGYVTSDGKEYLFDDDGIPVRVMYQTSETTIKNRPAYNIPAIVNGSFLVIAGWVIGLFGLMTVLSVNASYDPSYQSGLQAGAIILFLIGLVTFIVGNALLIIFYKNN